MNVCMGSVFGDVMGKMVGVFTQVYSKLMLALRASDMPGREHYIFSLRELESVCQVHMCTIKLRVQCK